jgi:hypothetical protein
MGKGNGYYGKLKTGIIKISAKCTFSRSIVHAY